MALEPNLPKALEMGAKHATTCRPFFVSSFVSFKLSHNGLEIAFGSIGSPRCLSIILFSLQWMRWLQVQKFGIAPCSRIPPLFNLFYKYKSHAGLRKSRYIKVGVTGMIYAIKLFNSQECHWWASAICFGPWRYVDLDTGACQFTGSLRGVQFRALHLYLPVKFDLRHG